MLREGVCGCVCLLSPRHLLSPAAPPPALRAPRPCGRRRPAAAERGGGCEAARRAAGRGWRRGPARRPAVAASPSRWCFSGRAAWGKPPWCCATARTSSTTSTSPRCRCGPGGRERGGGGRLWLPSGALLRAAVAFQSARSGGWCFGVSLSVW